MKLNSSISNRSIVTSFGLAIVYEDNLQETDLPYLMLQDAPDVNNN